MKTRKPVFAPPGGAESEIEFAAAGAVARSPYRGAPVINISVTVQNVGQEGCSQQQPDTRTIVGRSQHESNQTANVQDNLASNNEPATVQVPNNQSV